MAGVADLIIKMSMDSRGVSTGADQVEGKLSSAAGKAKLAYQALAAGGIAIAAKELFDLGVEAESWQRKFDTVFGEAGDTVAAWADDFNERFGISEDRLRGVLAGVGDLLVPMGFARDIAGDMSTDVLTLAGALSEWKGGTTDVKDATDILTRAILGERDALIGLGIKISEEEVKAGLLERGLDDLTGSALAQAKAQVTLELITGKSADAMDLFAKGGSDALTAQNELKAAIDTVKVSLGEAIVELTPVVRGFADLVGVLNKVDGLVPGVAVGIATLALGLGAIPALFIGAGVAIWTGHRPWAEIAATIHSDAKTISLGFKQSADALEVFRAKLREARADGTTFLGWAAPPLVIDGGMIAFNEKPLSAETVGRISLSIQLAAAQAAADAARSARIAEAEDAFGASLAAGFSQALLDNQGDLTAAIEDLVANAANQRVVNAQMNIMGDLGLGQFAEGLTGSPEEIAAALDTMLGGGESLSNLLSIAEALGDSTSAAFIRGLINDASRLTAIAEWYANAGETARNAYVAAFGNPVLPGGTISPPTGGVPTPVPRAIGGPVTARMPYLVGERGPELFVPNAAGSIIPGGGGATVVINVAGSVVTERDLLGFLRRGLRELAQSGGTLQL